MPGRGWYVETFADGQLRRFPIATLPFRVGRQHGLDLLLPADSVSKVHAEIYAAGPALRIRDLGSRNGTFLNRVLVEDAALCEGDVLHFADFELRVGRFERPDAPLADSASRRPTVVAGCLPHRSEEGTRRLQELLGERLVTVAFQPIVRLSEGSVAGYEALGRGRHPSLPEGPRELFRIAETIEAEAELSRLFRRKAIELGSQRAGLPPIFLNTHPAEFAQRGLLESLDELRASAPVLELALEIHESTLTSLATIAELRATLVERNIALVYDNFGAGRARLHELAEAPPNYLKFTPRYVTGLDRAPAPRHRLIASLVAAARKLGTSTVAVGIETESEARACAKVGFAYGQGTYLGRPRSIEEIGCSRL